jgi:putative transport protein
MQIDLSEFLRSQPAAALFLVLGLGYLIGKTRIRGFELGSVTGVLFAGLVFGRMGFEIPAMLQSVGFILFIFSIGLQSGPTFFGVLATDGAKHFMLALVIASTGFGVAALGASLLEFDPGIAAGMLAGGLTSSPTLAAAQDAVHSGVVPIPEGFTAEQLVTNVTTGYAITYIFGLVGLLLLVRLLPRLMGIQLKQEAAALAKEVGLEEGEATTGPRSVVTRAFELQNEELCGIPLEELKRRAPDVVAVLKIRRAGEMIPIEPETRLEPGDHVLLMAHLERMLTGTDRVGPELADADLYDFHTEAAQVVVTLPKAAGLTIGELDMAAQYRCILAEVRRMGVPMPAGPEFRLETGDVLSVTGPREGLTQLGEALGHLERAVDETDLVTFAIGIVAGLFIGALSIKLGNASIGLGSAGGLLVSGLVIGYLRSIRPTFGRVPSAARWVFMELGLLIFIAGVGLRAGGGIVEALRAVGPSLFLCGILVTTIPVFVGYLFGRYVLGIHPVLLLGGITGSMTSGAALAIVNTEAGNTAPALGYTGAYAFANVLLTVAGAVMMRL